MRCPIPLLFCFWLLGAPFSLSAALPTEGLPLDLSPVANMALADELPGDRRGGWTDQGRGNDLASLKPGRLFAEGLLFNVPDPARHEGRSSLLLSGPNRDYFPKTVTLPLAAGTKFSHLYLLHATAWTPGSNAVVGTLTVRYEDGSEVTREVRARQDVADWWAPAALPNAHPVWQAEGTDGPFGLYASRFEFPEKTAKELIFASTGTAVWGIVAATIHDREIRFKPVPKMSMKSGPDWSELPAISLGIEPGSVFDFSSLNDAPAGRYGAIRATPTGHFEFTDRPGERVKFWGVNLTFGANFPDKAQADRLAERLARSGYNTVRFHHYDRGLVRNGGKSYEFDPERLDRLEYLFAACKRRGLYINIDLYTVRQFSQEEIPELGRPVWFEFKGLVPLFESAFTAWKRFTSALLTHRNPHTGLTWAEDPALIGICPINEDTLSKIITFYKLEELYAGVFEGWLALPQNAWAQKLEKPVAYNRFLIEVQQRSDARMRAHLRSLGVKGLLTGANWMTYEETNYLREHYDYVDQHGYWDHPTYPAGQWKLPAKFHQGSATNKLAAFPRNQMSSRIFGRPFVITEFTYCWPNRYRAEGAALSAAYASLQDWDGMYHFNYSDVSGDKSYPATMFELASDPIRLLSDRVAALIFRAGWIKPAPSALAATVHLETSFAGSKEFTWPFSNLGLVTRIGSVNGDTSSSLTNELVQRFNLRALVSDRASHWQSPVALPVFPANTLLIPRLEEVGAIPRASIDQASNLFKSETGQIELQGEARRFKLVTDHAECLALPADASDAGAFARVRNRAVAAGLYVAAVDRQPLAQSHRVLVLFLTDLVNTGSQFSGENREVLDERGDLPYLVRKGSAELQLKVAQPESWQVWSVDPTGRRIRALHPKITPDGLALELSTAAGPDGVAFAYELLRKN